MSGKGPMPLDKRDELIRKMKLLKAFKKDRDGGSLDVRSVLNSSHSVNDLIYELEKDIERLLDEL